MPKKPPPPPQPGDQPPAGAGAPQERQDAQNTPLDQQNIAAELPPDARERLAESRGEGGRRKLFTSDLSGQEFSTLLKAGYRPLGLVMGVSVYAAYQNGYEFQMISGWTYGWTGMGAIGGGGFGSYNQEVQHFTDAMYAARDLAMGRLQREALELGAEGVVGMRVEVSPSLSKDDPEFWNELNERDSGMPANHWRTFLVDMFAIGTAVAPLSAEHQIAKPQMMVFLDK